MSYKEKDRDQWTPDDVADAIRDGLYIKGLAPARRAINSASEQPAPTTKYLQNRLARLDTIMANLLAVAKHRGVHPFDIARQYLPERDRVRAEIRQRTSDWLNSPEGRTCHRTGVAF